MCIIFYQKEIQESSCSILMSSSQGSIAIEDAKDTFDACLRSLDIPLIESGLSNTQTLGELKNRFGTILEEVTKIVECLSGQSIDVTRYRECRYCQLLTNDIKDKYDFVAGEKEKLQVATCLPRSKQITEIATLLNVSLYMGNKISKLRNEYGAFSFTEKKIRQQISPETKLKVKEHYLSPLYSKIMAGQYDTVYSDKTSQGHKERVAKQLMLVTLTELHSSFVHSYPDNPISLSEFAKHHPRQCRWVWNNGHHRNCTCIIHENLKLLLEATYSPRAVKNRTHHSRISV